MATKEPSDAVTANVPSEVAEMIEAAAAEAGVTRAAVVRQILCDHFEAENTVASWTGGGPRGRYRPRGAPTTAAADARQVFDDLRTKQEDLIVQRNNAAAVLYRDGRTDAEIGKLAGVSGPAAMKWRKTAGCETGERSKSGPTIPWGDARAPFRDIEDWADEIASERTRWIKDLWDEGYTDEEIAEFAGVSRPNVRSIRRDIRTGGVHNHPAETVAEVMRWHEVGLTPAVIAPRVGLTARDVSTILRGERNRAADEAGEPALTRPVAVARGPKLRGITRLRKVG